jgi:hypothetical protein
MKKYLSIWAFALMAVFSFVVVSCGDDDKDDAIQGDTTIVGTWEVTSVDFSSPYGAGDEIGGFEIGDIEVIDGLKVGDRVTFNANGTYQTRYETGKWSVKGNALTMTSDDVEYDEVVISYMNIKSLTSTFLDLILDYEGFFQYEVKFKRV